MKTLKNIGLCLFVLFGGITYAQEFSETLKNEKKFPSNSSDNLLVVYNIEGSIAVEGYSGTTVLIEAKKKVKGNNSRQLDQGKQEVGMKVATKGNIVYVYLDSPYTEFDLDTGRFNHKGPWDGKQYSYTLDYTIKVPTHTNVELSAINRGNITVKNIDAKDISVSNINGEITLENVAGKTYANALNRDINISYSKNPKGDSVFKSLNGDINISVEKSLNADVSFKSLNGEIYTNLDTQSSNATMKLNRKEGKRGTKYKMNKNTEFQIGKGGVRLDFDVLNGDVTIKG